MTFFFMEVTDHSSQRCMYILALVEMITFLHNAEMKWLLVELLHLSINPLINAATRS